MVPNGEWNNRDNRHYCQGGTETSSVVSIRPEFIGLHICLSIMFLIGLLLLYHYFFY